MPLGREHDREHDESAAGRERPPAESTRPVSPVAAAAGATDTIGRVKELQRLLEDGVLTQAEFDRRKREILGEEPS